MCMHACIAQKPASWVRLNLCIHRKRAKSFHNDILSLLRKVINYIDNTLIRQVYTARQQSRHGTSINVSNCVLLRASTASTAREAVAFTDSGPATAVTASAHAVLAGPAERLLLYLSSCY